MKERTYGEMLVEKILGRAKGGNGRININFGIEISKMIPELKMPKKDQIDVGISLFHVLEEALADTFYRQGQEILTTAISNLIYRKDEKKENNTKILLKEIREIAEQKCKPRGEKALNLIIEKK